MAAMHCRHERRLTHSIAVLGVLGLLGCFPKCVQAHRLDQYLQASQVSIDSSTVTVNVYMTPGVLLARRVLEDIDMNGDNVISSEEATRYARKALGAMSMTIDRRPVGLALVGAEFPPVEDLNNGAGEIRITAVANLPRSFGVDHLLRFENGFDPSTSLYLANAMVPKDPGVVIQSQSRNPSQSRLEIRYEYAQRVGWRRLALSALAGLAAALGTALWARRSRPAGNVRESSEG